MTATVAPPGHDTDRQRPTSIPEHTAPDPLVSATPLTAEEAAEFPHQCDPETLPRQRQRRARRARPRLIGLDVARGLALVGMIAVHTISSTTEQDDMSIAWTLASGKASALFAVLGGVGLALMTGRTQPPRGRWALRATSVPVVRGLLLILFGLALSQLVGADQVFVVLPYLGAMFVLAAVLVPLRTRSLLVIGASLAIVMPVVSHVVRQSITAPATLDMSWASLRDPMALAQLLLFTGAFPAATWIAYICIGMAIGRAELTSRLVVAKILAGGVLLTLVTSVAASVLVQGFGLRQRLADDVAGTMSFQRFVDYLVFGSEGSLPTTSWWWLGVSSPHTGTPLDLLHTIGTSLAVIGACLALAQVFGHRFLLIAVPGSMTLTLYTIHVLLVGPLGGFSDGAHFLVQLLLLLTFAIIWGRYFQRGPLERALSLATHRLTPSWKPATGAATASAAGAPAVTTAPHRTHDEAGTKTGAKESADAC